MIGAIPYRGKQFQYCEADIIRYRNTPYYTVEQQARDWWLKRFENKPIPPKMPRDVILDCTEELSISWSSAANGLALARGGRKPKHVKNQIFG